MKTLSLLLIPFAFLSPSLAVSQVNCTTYLGGEVTCMGPGGYQAQGRQHLGGVESWYDNRGATATVRHGTFGSTSIDTTSPSSAILINARPGPLLSPTKGAQTSEALRESMPSASDTYGNTDGHTASVPDKGSLPKTPEEYRLSILWMKAVQEKNFEKAEELKQLLWQEQFSHANAAGKVRMFNQERAERRQEMMDVFDRAEKRIRWENRPAKLATFHKFKERALTSYDKREAEADQVFYEKLQEWKEEKESNDRLAKFEADLVSLRALELDPVEYQKKEDELLEQWGKAEDEQKQRTTAVLNARLDRLIAEEAIQRKGKNKKVIAR